MITLCQLENSSVDRTAHKQLERADIARQGTTCWRVSARDCKLSRKGHKPLAVFASSVLDCHVSVDAKERLHL